MDFQLTEAQRMTQQLAREFAAKEIAPYAAQWDESCAFPWEAVRKLADLNLLGIIFPQADGGAGLDYHELCTGDRRTVEDRRLDRNHCCLAHLFVREPYL